MNSHCISHQPRRVAPRIRSGFLFVVFAAVLASCGGGSSSGPSSPDVLKALTTLSAKASITGVTLAWEATGATSYSLHRCPVPAAAASIVCPTSSADACGSSIGVSTATSFVDVPPSAAPQAYCYQVKACSDAAGQACGPVVGAVAAAQAIPAPVRPMSTVISDKGREITAGHKTTLHAFADGAKGVVTWRWTQESGPKVTLSGADSDSLTFTAPNISVNTLLSFELRTTDDNGPGTTAKVAVTVVPANNVIVESGAAVRTARVGDQVSLHALGSSSGLTYAWRQVSPATPQVALTGANTSNPSFVLPALPPGTKLLFEVTTTDPATGRQSIAQSSVGADGSVSTAPGLMPRPLQLGQTLQVPQAPSTTPLPGLQQVVPVPQPPQNLLLLPSPAVTATGGASVALAMNANGGTQPYQWSWTQTSGPAATLTSANQAVATVQVPVVASAQVLTFQATLTDGSGAVRTAQAVVQATTPPQPGGNVVPTPVASLTPVLAFTGTPVQVAVPLTAVTLAQDDGPRIQVAQQVAGGGKTSTLITLTAPLIANDSAPASLRATGLDRNGKDMVYIIPVVIHLTPGQLAASTAPPQVPPQPHVLAPQQDARLEILGGSELTVEEGRSNAAIAFAARGGKGTASYQYRIDYQPTAGGPSIGFMGVAAQSAQFNVPLVDRPIDLTFLYQVTDGVQVAQKTFTLHVADQAPTATVAALAPLSVQAGHAVTLSMPTPTGGFPYMEGSPAAPTYRYSVRQISGPNLPVPPLERNGQPGNFGFNAPALAVGSPDQVLVFELAATDRSGSVVKVTQQVTVQAPSAPAGPPLVARSSVMATLALEPRTMSIPLSANATGGTAPYTYAWTVQSDIQPLPGKSPFVVSDLSASGPNPTVNLSVPAVYSRRAEMASYTLRTTLRVTDSAGAVATATSTSSVVATELVRPGTEALLCGDIATRTSCTDLDLVLAMTSTCPDSQPYAANTIIQNGDKVEEFRSCVDSIVGYNLYIGSGSRDNPLCRSFDASATTGQLTCHLVCYGNGCNIDTNPPDDTLIGPPGSDGLLTVGGKEGVTSP